MPVICDIQEKEFSGTEEVFLSDIRSATSTADSLPQFEDDLRSSAQEQVEFMLEDDEKIPLVIPDDEIKVETGIFGPDIASKEMKERIMRSLSDLEWMHNTLLKMDLMKDFASHWANISSNLPKVIKLIEVTSKVLEAVGYGTVVLPAELLKTWLPYIRKMKSLSDKMGKMEAQFSYKMREDICQSLPSNDQADILADWICAGQVKYPDLSKAFEIWCYRTKSAQRILDGPLTESAMPLSAST
ncbi:unnamed protein product [Withania somnifera]